MTRSHSGIGFVQQHHVGDVVFADDGEGFSVG